MHWNLMNETEFGSFKCLILKYKGENYMILCFSRIGSPKEIRSPLFNLRKFSATDKSTAESCRMHWSLMNDEEFGSFNHLVLKCIGEHQIIQPFCRIGPSHEHRYPLFHWRKFLKADKSPPQSCRIHINLMSDEEFASFKILILEYRKSNKIIQVLCKIGYPQEIRFSLFNLKKFWKTDKSTAESCRMH